MIEVIKYCVKRFYVVIKTIVIIDGRGSGMLDKIVTIMRCSLQHFQYFLEMLLKFYFKFRGIMVRIKQLEVKILAG